MTDQDDSLKVIRRPDPNMRIRAIEFIKGLYCINCPFKSECSSRYPQYLIKCKYLEEWVLKVYSQEIGKEEKE